MKKIKIIALCGKAGSGKNFILNELIQRYSNKLNRIISCTTRPPREGERNGIDYYYLSPEEFCEYLLNGNLIESTVFNNWYYGTLKSSLSIDKVNIGIFNPEGVMCLMEDHSLDLQIYYIQASDKERLLRQLNREEFPNVSEITRRYSMDKQNFALFEEDTNCTILVNNTPLDFENCIKTIEEGCL